MASAVRDRYRLVGRIGVGGSAVVWRAHDEVLRRDVAVKVLSAATAPEPALRERIRQEARVAAQLHHPNIVEVFDYGEVAGEYEDANVPFVVMELVEGRSLTELLADGPLPWRDAVRIGAQVASALATAHAAGVVHRDVKPGNIMVTKSGVKLVDFGISAKAGAPDETDGEVLGTPAYLAPERLDGGPVRVASDVYGLGLLLYRMLAGRAPWRAATVTEMVSAHLRAEPAPLPEIPGLSRAVITVVQRCLAKAPEDRPAAADVADVLADAVGVTPRYRSHHLARNVARPRRTGAQAGPVTETRRTLAAAVSVAHKTVAGVAAGAHRTLITTLVDINAPAPRPDPDAGSGQENKGRRRRPKNGGAHRMLSVSAAALTLGASMLFR